MKLNGLKLGYGIKIEIPPQPISYYINTFGRQTGSTSIKYADITGSHAMEYDNFGNLYVAGSGQDRTNLATSWSNTGILVKFNESGNVVWQQALYSASSFTSFQSLGLDNLNNVYVSGFNSKNYYNASRRTDTYQIQKYDSNGVLQWQRNLGYAIAGNSGGSFGRGLVVDKASGNCYVVGNLLNNPATPNQYSSQLLVKYNSSGTVQWARILSRYAKNSSAYQTAVDSSGNVYSVGNTIYYKDNQETATIVKYSDVGTILWQVCLVGTVAGGRCRYYGITIDSSNNIYACGSTNLPAPGSPPQSAMIVKYNANSNLIWQRQLSSSGAAVILNGLVTDTAGNIYATGIDSTSSAILIVKYNTFGVLQWQRKLRSTTTNISCEGYSITINKENKLCIGGISSQTGTSNNNILTLKVPADGSLTGTYTVNSITFVYEVGTATETALNFTPTNPVMSNQMVNFSVGGKSTLLGLSSTYVNNVTSIP